MIKGKFVLLHEDKKALEEAIRATANTLSLPIEYVEKDYWITYTLKTLASSDMDDEIVFKGGTSLSKAYNLISRFSEDIDIAVLTESLSGNQIKTKLKKITNCMNTIFKEIESPDTSKGSKFRKIRFQYPRMDNSVPIEGQITDSLLLEVNAFTDPEPYSKIFMSSYIAEYFKNHGFKDAIKEYGLEAFEMNVLCTSRTLCEKVMGLVKASYSKNNIVKIAQKIRHIYDIHYLLTDKFTRDFLESDNFLDMMAKVIVCDKEAFGTAEWLKQPIANACVFSSLIDIWPALKNTYHGDFKAMVVGDALPSITELTESMSKVHKQLVKFDAFYFNQIQS